MRDEKKKDEVFARADWTFDFDEAKTRARSTGKPIFAYFTRSYAPCNPCTRVEKAVLSRDDFVEFSKGVVLFCHITSHVASDPHQDLLENLAGGRTPSVLFLDPDGRLLARIRRRSVSHFREIYRACCDYLAARRKVERGAEGFEPDLLIARMRMGALDFDSAKKEAAKISKVDGPKRKALEQELLNLEVMTLARARTLKASAEAGRRFVVMWKEGRIPTRRASSTFFSRILDAAFVDEDPALYERALKRYEASLPEGPAAQRAVDYFRERLRKMKKEK